MPSRVSKASNSATGISRPSQRGISIVSRMTCIRRQMFRRSESASRDGSSGPATTSPSHTRDRASHSTQHLHCRTETPRKLESYRRLEAAVNLVPVNRHEFPMTDFRAVEWRYSTALGGRDMRVIQLTARTNPEGPLLTPANRRHEWRHGSTLDLLATGEVSLGDFWNFVTSSRIKTVTSCRQRCRPERSNCHALRVRHHYLVPLAAIAASSGGYYRP